MMVSFDEETIVAQATPKGSGALAIVRISGTTAFEITNSISQLSSGKKITELPTHTIHFGRIVDNDLYIDQVMFLLMHGPKTFTGQDTVEITCHNNPFIVEKIIQIAIKQGARLASAGEFTKRAVLNGKIDLLQAEAINELIHAQTQMGLKQSLAQVEGTLSHWIVNLESALLKALAFSEASFEFIDEEMNFDVQIKEIIHNTLSTIESIKNTYNYQQQIRQGFRIAFIGSVNAGKSSLFNVLLNQQRAIVTEIAGTTRDVIEASVCKDGNNWTFVDTAGLRETDNEIEQEGIARSLKEAELADIILLIYDGSHQLTAQEHAIYKEFIKKYNKKVILVCNKADRGTVQTCFPSFQSAKRNEGSSLSESISISTTTQQNIDQLEKSITTKVQQLFNQIESPFLLNQRQYNLIVTLEQKLQELKKMADGKVQFELLSHHLKDALSLLSELTGKSISEKGMDQIFRQFCVGK